MSKKIMIIDDTVDTLEVTQLVLEMRGFSVEAFSDALKAMARLKSGYHPDLILLDMRMPELPGPEFCEQIRSDDKLKNAKIVFFTASSELDRGLLEKYGVLGFIFKPFDNHKLVDQINNYLKK